MIVVEYQCVRFIYYRDIILFYHDCHLIIMCQMYSTRYKKLFCRTCVGFGEYCNFLCDKQVRFAVNKD